MSAAVPPIQLLRIDDANWQTYELFLGAIGERNVRCTYDRGRLELMIPGSRAHQRKKRVLASMVQMIAFEWNLPLDCCGGMTIRRKDLDRGFEPDESFYIENAC